MLTIGQNSYVDIAYANEYVGRKVYADEWINSTEATREKALQEATFKVELFKYDGIKASTTQTLEFPRIYHLKDLDDNSATVPDQIKYAVCEEALAILKYGNTTRINAQRQNVTGAKVGNISEFYSGQINTLLSPEARILIKPFQAGSVRVSAERKYRKGAF